MNSVKLTESYANMLIRQKAVERELLADRKATPGWIERPHSSGWWLWREGGGYGTELLLLCHRGIEVVGDDEYEQETGLKDENDGFSYNYWSGTQTTQRMMPGLWLLLS